MEHLSKTLSIRLAESSDVKSIESVEIDRYGSSGYPTFSIRQYLDLFPSSCWVAELDGELVGYAFLGIQSYSDIPWLLSVVVKSSASGIGIGRKIIKKTDEYCIENDIKECFLTVVPSNNYALNIYKSLGFLPLKTLSDYYNVGDKRIIMRKSYTT